ncbi:MAG: GNAT family N-acetyltransferase [Chloroflexota bacterium]
MVAYRFITTTDPAYAVMRQWRYRLFFAPHGLAPTVIDPAAERPFYHLIAVDEAETAVGYGHLQPQANGSGIIRQIVVVPEWQKQGIGQQLVSRLVEKAVALGLNRVTLAARTEALRFYERLGFVPTGAVFASPLTAVPHLPMLRRIALTVPHAFYQVMVDHVQAVYPQEGCGLLAGQENGRLTHHYPIRNQLQSQTAYEMEPIEQIQAMLAMEKQGWELLAIYHSHPTSPATPSPTDVAQAYYPDTIQIIISLQNRADPAVFGYTIVAGNIQNVALTIEQP